MIEKSNNLKKIFYLFILFLNSFLLFSCKIQTEETNKTVIKENKNNNSSRIGYINLSLNTNKPRNSISLAEVEKLVNLYELIIYNETTPAPQAIQYNEEQPVIEIPVGTWNLLILAGKDNSLIGTGYCDNFTIEENTITDLSLQLLPVDISLSVPDEIYVDESFNMELSIDTRNPYIKVSSVKLSYLEDEFSFTITGKAQSFSKTKEIKISEINNISMKLINSNIYFVNDLTSSNIKLSTISTFDTLLNSEAAEIENITVKSFSAVEKVITTGINFSINWAE